MTWEFPRWFLSVFIFCSLNYDFPGGSDGKELACNVGDPGSIHGSGRSPGEGEHEREVAQSCPTLCNTMDCSLPGSSVHGIFQAIVLQWIDISFSKGSSQPRDRTQVSHIVDRRFTVWATSKVPQYKIKSFLKTHNKNTWVQLLFKIWNKVTSLFRKWTPET